MADVKTYQIVINGLTESISAVDALNKQLDVLDKKIAALQGKAVNVSAASSGGGGGSRISELSDEDKLLKQIEATQSKINQADMADYKVLLDKKNELKELVKEQKSMAAEARLSDNAYANTMLGMKEHLADIKAVMQTVDLNDTDTFEKLTKDANELNAKLLEIEKSYGQFGRNVGNYASAAEGFKGLKIDIGGMTQEFDNAKQALMTLKKEMQTLATKKDLGIITDEEEERLKSLIPTVKQLESSVSDAGKPMDALMDNMQSFVALAQAGKGLAAFFGLEGTGIDETIKNLVALQNAMQGLQTIQKQLQTGEGLGKYFVKGNTAIDNFTKNLFGVKKATTEVTTASKAATTATQAQTTATASLTVAQKAATVAARGLSMALKAIGIGIILEGISLLVEGVKGLVGWIGDWAKGDADLVNSMDVLNAAIDRQNDKLSRNLELIEARRNAGLLSAYEAWAEKERAYAESLKDTNEEMIKRANLLNDEGLWPKANYGGYMENVIGDTGVTTIGGFETEIKNLEEFTKRWEDLEQAVANGSDIFGGMADTASDARDEFAHLNKLVGEDFVNAFAAFADGTAEGAHSLMIYIDEMDRLTKGSYSKALKLVKVDNEDLQKQLDEALNQVDKFRKDIENQNITLSLQFDSKLQSELDSLFPLEAAQRKIDEWKMVLINGVNDVGNALTTEEREKIQRIITESEKNLEERKRNAKKGGRSLSKNAQDIERNINTLRLRLMKDGLNKRLMQLDEEKRQTLAKLKKNSQDYLEAEKIFNQLRIQEIEKYESKVNEALSKDREQIENTRLENQIEEIENYISRLEKNVPRINELFSKNDLQDLLIRGNYPVVMNYLKLLDEAFEKGWDNISDEMKDFIDQIEAQFQAELDTIRSYSDIETATLKDSFQTRINDARDYYILTLDMMTIAVEEERALREEQLKNQKDSERKSATDRFKEQRDEYQRELDAAQKQFDALKEIANEGRTNLTDEQREQWKQLQDIILTNQEYIKQSTENFTKELENIEKEYDNAIVALNLQTFEKRNSIQEKYFDTQIENYRDFNSKLNQEIQKQPVVYKGGFDIINIGATRKNFKEIRDAAKTVLNGIQEDKNELNAKWIEGILTPETYSSTLRQLNDIERATTEEFEQISEKIKEAWGDWWGSIDQWIQLVGQAASQIMSSLSEITSNQYEKMIDQQQKYIDEYSDLLDKQKDMTQKYADAVDDIEDELSSARGDRRQHLIDQLNAEIQAQRASLAEEKRIEKEKEKAEKRKTELEYKQALAEKKMSVAQAALNAVMAVSMAAVNKWPIPAIPMMALAAAVGAAQVAAANSQYIPKPSYGDGGVIVGKAHKDGGVPVLGGRAEVEGGEFITNKRTTQQNTPLLEYINSKKKRIDLSDMIEFFNDKPRATIKNIRSKFADGGTLPNIDLNNFNDRTIVIKDEGVYQVQVVDVISKAADVKRVQVLAGLNPNNSI